MGFNGDSSPDSLIYALFSSSSPTLHRSSSASDSLLSQISLLSSPFLLLLLPFILFLLTTYRGGDKYSFLGSTCDQLAGHHDENNIHSCAAPDPNKFALTNKHTRLSTKAEKPKDYTNADLEDDNRAADSASNSFSLALRECQDQRSTSEPQSSNLHSTTPRLPSLKNNPVVTTRKTGTLPTLATPNSPHNSFSMQKGWSSERVPLHNNGGRNHTTNNPALLTLNSGRTLPSKWEDAERWIFSPISCNRVVRNSVQHPQRRPKSKSGPLGPPGIAYYSLYSPAAPAYQGRTLGNFVTGSPFSAGLISTNGLAGHSGGHEASFHGQAEPSMARSVSVHGCSEMLAQLSSTSGLQQESEENLTTVDTGTDASRVVSRRDTATQMSPESSVHSSPRMKSSTTASSSYATHMLELGAITSKLEIKDVQVDNQVTMTRWSKKHEGSLPWKDTLDDGRKKDADAVCRCSDLDNPNLRNCLSKDKREEATIKAWENLQRAKADAAIRKLEMKLEKKRATSMDKIMNRLKYSQKKAQEMRSSVMANQSPQDNRSSFKPLSFYRTGHMGSLSGCFTCHAF